MTIPRYGRREDFLDASLARCLKEAYIMICATLPSDGRRWRGWFACGDWPIQERVIPDASELVAIQRAQAAVNHLPIPAFGPANNAIIERATEQCAMVRFGSGCLGLRTL